MKKKLLLFSTISMLAGICIGACGNTNAVQASNDELEMEFIDEYYNIELWKDPETGVEYFIYSDHIGYGAAGGMCPRYNTDGTLYVD